MKKALLFLENCLFFYLSLAKNNVQLSLLTRAMLGQPGRHNAKMLSQLRLLNHLAPEGNQLATRWDPLLKSPVTLGCLHSEGAIQAFVCVFVCLFSLVFFF